MLDEKTKKLYQRQSKRFVEWVNKHNGKDKLSCWVDALKFYAAQLDRSSWKQYKYAIAWYLKEENGEEFSSNFLKKIGQEEKPERKKKKRIKYIDDETFAVVFTKLKDGKGISPKIADLLIATVATGLRPCEWAEACFVGNTLIVKNAKYKPKENQNDLLKIRGNGPYRTLILNIENNLEVKNAIQNTLEWLHKKDWNGSPQRSVSRSLKNTIKELIRKKEIKRKWKNFCIYDCRHQFSLNARADLNIFKGEVAAVMGHISAMTAFIHYGKNGRGYAGRTIVKPSKESVEAVNQKSLEVIKDHLKPRGKDVNISINYSCD